MATAAGNITPDYSFSATYDPGTFQSQYEAEFKGVPKFNRPSMPDLLFVLGKIGVDARINDVRWAAYMLATMFVESSHIIRVTKQTKDRHGQVKTVNLKEWRNFAPVMEAGTGKGLKYGLPVKVSKLPNGNARITEYDGDQFELMPSGVYRASKRTMTAGLKSADISKSSIYATDEGDEQLYFGRGLVQLTWWFNYAKAGAALLRGLDFVFDPSLVNDPSVAYSILATGMCSGTIFANGHKFSDYFDSAHTDYVKARNMVNAGASLAHKQEVAGIAERFERVLLAARPGQQQVAQK